MMKAGRLIHINELMKITIEKGIGDVQLTIMLEFADGKCQEEANSGGLNDGTKCFVIINAFLLMKSFSKKIGFVLGRYCWDLTSITFRNFDQNIKCSEKTLNPTFKITSHQEQMILSSSMYEKIYLHVSLKEFLKLFKCLASSVIHTVSGWLDLLFKALHQERKRRKERILTRLAWAPPVVVVLPLFIDIWNEVFS